MDLTENQIKDFNKYYQKASKLQKGIILLEGYRPKSVGFFKKIRARKAIKNFESALAIYPESFASLFFLGKIYQRLADYEKSLEYFEIALKFEHENHSLPQEASLVAMHLNQIDKGISYSREAVRRNPKNVAVLGNHAMNLLIGGFDKEAKEIIDKAMSIDPKDEINRNVKRKIEDVIKGEKQRPSFLQAMS